MMKKSILVAVLAILFMNILPVLAGENRVSMGLYNHKEGAIPANDAVAVVVNPINHLRNLSTEQLKNIFTHRFLYWDALGSQIDYSIRPIIGMDRHHVKEVFQQRVLAGAEFQGCEVKGSDQEILEEVARDEAAIGIVSLSSAMQYKWVRIIAVDGKKATMDNPEYPLFIPQ